MNILYITSEAAPFCKTGGLADVLGSLPPAVAAEGDRVFVLLPLYGQIAQRWREKMNFRCYIYVDLGWRHEYCGLFSLEYRGVTWYFVDNERYFRRRSLYGDMDDGERFAFFSKAAEALLPHLAEYPNVIHCNDWQTALVPVYLRDAGNDLPVVFTIHNIEYQGKYGPETVEDLFGLNRGWYDGGILRMDGCVNLMKAAMLTANAVTTVSPTYARQLHDPAYACGLEQVVQLIDYKLSGVLNGLDMESFDPAHDASLPQTYDPDHMEGKAVCKRELQRQLGLAQEPDTPLTAIVSRLVGHKGMDLVCQGLGGIMATGCQLVVLGQGEPQFEDTFRWAQSRWPGRVSAQITYSDGSYADNGALSSKGLYRTDKNGQIILSGITGTVIVTEVETIKGYRIDDATRSQTIEVRANDTQQLWFYNAPTSRILLHKVDKATGKVTVVDYAAAVDCGTVINEALARVQAEGGIAQGIGHALYEIVEHDDRGRLRTGNFMSYKLPTRLDIGSIRVAFEPSYEPTGPFGAKSIGEVVINTPLAAVASAVAHATGHQVRSLPITPEKALLGE